ncbi:hypothetical protein [uncultured Desulfuromusa sp.]|uniref:hypothetical protein n=1 Tax=uncultured Desulfuromusa sp. TaxID=219183 RepID=UPI002AA88348|nr:hypothetical protein [uncultured Desulfuromusa sp.]
MNYKIFFVLMVLCSLMGCESTKSGMGRILPTQEFEHPAWYNEPLVTGDVCDTFTYDNVNSFLSSYEQEQQNLEKNSKEIKIQKMANSYTMASLLINRSQLCLCEALKLKNTTDDIEKEKQILLSGTSLSKNQIEMHREISNSISQKIIEASEQSKTLKEEQKRSFTLGSGIYLLGNYQTQKVSKSVLNYLAKVAEDLSFDNKSTSEFPLPSLEILREKYSATYGAAKIINNIGSGIETHMLKTAETGQYLYLYSQKQNLDLPSDTSAYIDFD